MARSNQNTTFVVKSKQNIPGIKGTIPSLHNNILLTSTGVPTIDDFIGCVPIGSILLLEEDLSNYNNEVLTKCFIAEGVTNEHDIFLASDGINSILQSLPSPVDSKNNVSTPLTNDELKIAWRYEKTVDKQPIHKYRIGHSFHMNKPISSDLLEKVNINTFIVNDHDASTRCPYRSLLKEIKLKLNDGGCVVSDGRIPNKILRIVISGLGSPRWKCNAENVERETLKFLYQLRFLLRYAMAVCLVTFPTHLIEDSSFISRLRHLSDTVIKLESFGSTTKEVSSTYKDYLGLFSVEKLPTLNSLTSHHPERASDLVFKMSRKKFIVERLHLPPLDLEEPRVQNYCTSKPGGKKSIDF